MSKDFCLDVKARIWPWLSYMCHIRSTAHLHLGVVLVDGQLARVHRLWPKGPAQYHDLLGVKGLGFRGSGVGFRGSGFRFWVWGLVFEVEGLVSEVEGWGSTFSV